MKKFSISTKTKEFLDVIETNQRLGKNEQELLVQYGDCATLVVDAAQYKRAFPLYLNLPTSVISTIENLELKHIKNAKLIGINLNTYSDRTTVRYSNGASFSFDIKTYKLNVDNLNDYFSALNVLKNIMMC